MPSLKHGHIWVDLGRERQPDGTVKRRGDYEHRLVWKEAHGEIPQGFHIHHINGIRTDNRLENLELRSWRDHGKIHGGQSRGKEDRWSLKYDVCVECGTTDRRYWARGMCSACYQRVRWNQPGGRWAEDLRVGWTR